jgi:hypothetical protein
VPYGHEMRSGIAIPIEANFPNAVPPFIHVSISHTLTVVLLSVRIWDNRCATLGFVSIGTVVIRQTEN